MHELERISLDAYLPVYGADAIDVGGATCLRAPHAPDSPMLNRVVGLGVDGAGRRGPARRRRSPRWATRVLRRRLAGRRPTLDGLARGARPRAGLGLDAVRARPAARRRRSRRRSRSSRSTPARPTRGRASSRPPTGCPTHALPWFARVPGLTAWHAFLALDGDEPAAAAAVWIEEHGRLLRLRGDRCPSTAARAARARSSPPASSVRSRRAARRSSPRRASAATGARARRTATSCATGSRSVRRRPPAAPAPAAVSRRRVRPEVVERRELEREGVRRLEDDGRRDAGLERLLPAVRAQAPPVARTSPRSPLGMRRREVVSDRGAEARNSSVITAQTAWTPTSCPPVRQCRPARSPSADRSCTARAARRGRSTLPRGSLGTPTRHEPAPPGEARAHRRRAHDDQHRERRPDAAHAPVPGDDDGEHAAQARNAATIDPAMYGPSLAPIRIPSSAKTAPLSGCISAKIGQSSAHCSSTAASCDEDAGKDVAEREEEHGEDRAERDGRG